MAWSCKKAWTPARESSRRVEALVQTQSARMGVGRFEIWRRAVALIQDYPYTGLGLNAFLELHPHPPDRRAGRPDGQEGRSVGAGAVS